VTDLRALITASPMSDGKERYALVMVDDITEGQKPVYNISPAIPPRDRPNASKTDWVAVPSTGARRFSSRRPGSTPPIGL
jgi:hypothetical protein